MTLEVEVPDPPDLSNRSTPDLPNREAQDQFDAMEPSGATDQFRRDGLESALRDGAWQEAFDEWAEYTDLTEAQFETVRDRMPEFDFFWDPQEERLRFTAPPVSEADVEGVGVDAATVSRALSDLGDVVLDVLQDPYEEYWSDDAEDVVWSEETFGQTRGEEEL